MWSLQAQLTEKVMIEEIYCPYCNRIFYDWAHADEHVCRPTSTETRIPTNEMEMEPERDSVLFTADRDVVEAAIAQVTSCEACNPDADWPFESILDSVM